jgi:alpha/beta superfamily hydrolase
VLFAILFAYGQSTVCVADASSPIDGGWVGYVSSNDLYFVLNLQSKGPNDCTGTVGFPRESEDVTPIAHLACNGASVQTSIVHGSAALDLDLRAGTDSMTGTWSNAGKSGAITLLPLRKMSRASLLPFAGDFEDGAGHEVVFSESLGLLYYFDRTTGRTGRLFPLENNAFFGGPTMLIYLPDFVHAAFSSPQRGSAPSVVLTYGASTSHLVRRRIGTQRDVQFAAPGATIAGTLRTPAGRAPFPAVLIISGSNGQPRSGFYSENDFIADQFVRLGVATLTFDKRGVGESTGASGDNGAEQVAAAAFRFLREQPEIDTARTGIWGISQGGIIAPKVATLTPGVAFIINCSGAVMDANTQEIERTALQMRADGFPESEISDAVAFQKLKFHYAQTGEGWDDYATAYKRYKDTPWFPDPYVGPPASQTDTAWKFWRESGDIRAADYWRLFQGPVLATWGEHETLSDANEDVTLFVQAMREAHNDRFSIVRIPNAEHSMRIAKTGGVKETRSLTSYSLQYFALLGQWLSLNGIIH